MVGMATSSPDVDLLSPIIVVPGKRIRNGQTVDGWDILAGQHRFKAMHTILNWDQIPCFVSDHEGLKAELVTIDENLRRKEISPAQASSDTTRRKEIYEALHPETHVGAVNQHTSARRHFGDERSSRFTADTAERTGRSERATGNGVEVRPR